MRPKALFWPALVAGVTVALGAAPVLAKNGGSKVKVQTVRAAKPAGTTAPSAAKAPKPARAPKATAATPKAKPAGAPKAAKAPKATQPSVPKATGKGGAKRVEPASALAITTPTVPLNKAQQKLLDNPNQRAKIEARLPPGTDVIAAASGFRNFGQFNAAVNNSYNLGLDFQALKYLMTGPEQLSLGQAKRRLQGVDPGPVDPSALDLPTATATQPKSKKR
jgi:hypothetical protein